MFLSPGVLDDCKEAGGVLTLQVRSPRLLSSSIVHGETILPLSELPTVSESEIFNIPHLHLPLTRPWDFKCKFLLCLINYFVLIYLHNQFFCS